MKNTLSCSSISSSAFLHIYCICILCFSIY